MNPQKVFAPHNTTNGTANPAPGNIVRRGALAVKNHVFMFNSIFSIPILSGTKQQTIRPVRKRLPTVGEGFEARVWLGTPYRSEQRRLLTSVITSVMLAVYHLHDGVVVVDGQSVSVAALASADGFTGPDAMTEWFRRGYGHRTQTLEVMIVCWAAPASNQTENCL
ncbi:MAG: hypothetical protein LBD30_07355 [Verrucomicrobiales bacterium]|jgi:hypothetical protein|nr:hypothetical protein [Verrucomicrobiales bacterium]